MTERALPVTILEPAGIDPELLDHTLSLRFDLGQFDPRITFTRNSSATYFGSDGLLKTASANEPRIDYDPVTGECKGFLVEEQRTNLLTYSEQFDSAAWGKTQATITPNAIVAPDGTLTADALIENTANSQHHITQTQVLLANTTYTMSVYVKPAGRTLFRLAGAFVNNWSVSAPKADFDLIAGTVSDIVGGSAGIQPVGNGWYRCHFVATFGAANASGGVNIILAATTSNSIYQGDGTSGIYIWGAQLEVGAFPTSYIPTPATFTSRNSTGTYFDSEGVMKTAAINEARYDHGLVDGKWVSKGLLLEGSATNLLTRSDNFANASWNKARTSVVSDLIVAPDGTLTGDKLVEDTQTGAHHVFRTFSFVAGTTYTLSCYVKAAERSSGIIQIGNGAVAFNGGIASCSYNLVDKTATKGVSGMSVGITELANGWFRVWVTGTADNTGSDSCFASFLSNGTSISYTGDGTSGIYIWGAQLEVGSQPTSYIKTESAAVTRAADVSTSSSVTRVADSAVMTGANFSSWYGQDEGTLFIDYQLGLKLAASRALSLQQSGTDNVIEAVSGSGVHGSVGAGGYMFVRNNGVVQASTPSAVSNVAYARYVNALSYKENSFFGARNGTVSAEDTSGTVPGIDSMYIGRNRGTSFELCGHIRRIAYYPKRLANAKLQALTA